MREGDMDGMRLRFVITSIVVPVLVAGAALTGGWWASGSAADPRPSLAAALDSVPADTKVAGFTDWAAIREHLGLGAASTPARRESLMYDSRSRDLSTRSVLAGSIEKMHDAYGWSAADLDWEVYGQAADGAAMVAHLDPSLSLDTVRAGLRKLGYRQDGRVWTIDADGVGAVDADLAASLGAVAIVPGRRLVVAADRETYVSTVLATVDRDRPSLLGVRAAADVAGELVGADTALLQAGAYACAASSLQDQDDDVRAQARTAIARAGGLEDVSFAGRALDDKSKKEQSMRFALAFGSPGEAAGQLAVRTALASGPFIGRTGRVEDSLVLTGSGVNGSTATLHFDHDPDSVVYMTGTGPLLFAGCPAG